MNAIRRKRTRRERGPAPVICLNGDQTHLSETYCGELSTLIQDRTSFSKFVDADIVNTADISVLNGVSSIADIKNLRADARGMLIEDLRGDWYKLIDIQLFMDALHIPPPLISSKSTRQNKFEEINTPENAQAGS